MMIDANEKTNAAKARAFVSLQNSGKVLVGDPCYIFFGGNIRPEYRPATVTHISKYGVRITVETQYGAKEQFHRNRAIGKSNKWLCFDVEMIRKRIEQERRMYLVRAKLGEMDVLQVQYIRDDASAMKQIMRLREIADEAEALLTGAQI